MRNNAWYLIIIFTFSISVLLAQNPSPHFIQLTTANGLPSPEVHCVTQDANGHMWFGTDNGVCKFNGYEFEAFGVSDGLKDNVIFDIFEDEHGRIWFGSSKGNLYFFQNDSIYGYEYNSLIQELQYDFSQAHLISVVNDTIVSYLYGLGILVIDPNGEFKVNAIDNHYMFLDYRPMNLSKAFVISSGINRDALLGCIEVQLINEVSRKIELPYNEDLNEGTVVGLFVSAGLILSTSDSLYFIDDNNNISSVRFPGNILTLLIDERDNNIWLSYGKDQGVRRYESLEAVLNNKYKEYFPGITVTDLHLDDNIIWASTLSDGIFLMPDKNTFKYDRNAGLSTNKTTAVAIGNNDSIFVKTNDGNIWLIHDQTSTNLNFPFTNKGTTDMTDLWYDHAQGTLWTNHYFFNKGEWERSNLPYARKYDYDELEGKLVIINNQGLYKYDFEHLERKVQFYKPVYTYARDAKGIEWVGSNDGLYFFLNDDLKKYMPAKGDLTIRVEDIVADSSGRKVFATKGMGLGVLLSDSLYYINKSNGIASDYIEDIENYGGKIFIATLSGLSVINHFGEPMQVIQSFNSSTGLPGDEIYCLDSYEKDLWISSNNGLFKWTDLDKSYETPKPFIKSLIINNKERKGEGTFNYLQSDIIFSFYSIDYNQLENILYRYKLKDDDGWILSKSTLINYANLSPGKYNFEVQAQSGSGNWSESTTYPFRIKPPWWNSWIARIMYFLSFGSIAFFIYKNRIKRITEKNTIALEIQELQRMATQAQMNPHFIFNCLNSIQSFINQDEKEKANAYLVLFSRLVRASLNASMKKVHSLEDEVALLTDYIELEKMRFKSAFEYDIKVDESIETYDTFLPPMLIQPIVENAIKHGLLPKENDDNKLEVLFHEENDHLIVHVIDNGVGLKPQHSNGHKSIGLSNTSKRLDLFNGSSKNNMVIADNDAVGLEGGTRVKLRLKKLHSKGY